MVGPMVPVSARPQHQRPAQRQVGLLAVTIAAACFGTFPYFARAVYDAGLDPEQAFFWRYCLAAVVLLPWTLPLLRRKRVLMQMTLAGIFLGSGVYVYLLSIDRMPVALAGLIFFTFPVFAFVYRTCLLRVRPTWPAVIATCLVIVGAAIACGTIDTRLVNLGYVVVAFLTPVFYGAMITLVSYGPTDVSPLSTTGCLYLGTALVAIPIIVVQGTPVDFADVTRVWSSLMGLIVVSGLIPGVLTTFGAPRAGAALAAIAASFELVAVLMSGWILLGEAFVPAQALAAGIIISAILLAARARV